MESLSPDLLYIQAHYTKRECYIPMRDGVRLFTSIYIPKDTSEAYPIMLMRTPYSAAPYGEGEYRIPLGPSMFMARAGYIFAYQDVRGKMMSEGDFEAVRPHNPAKEDASDIDESTDTYDTIEWLLDNLDNHNGNVGTWGISAPGFYTTHSLIDSHPALKAASPQAPVTDWFLDDDRHHNGAFLLQATFSFVSSYGKARPEPTTVYPEGFTDYGTPDGYQFYLDLGPLSSVNERYFNGKNALWNDLMAHGTYDAFWQARTPLPHLKDVQPAVLVVGGFFDAQDLYGPLKTYATLDQNNPDTPIHFVMGPWWHGGWARSEGERYQDIDFGSKTSLYYQEHIELPFFNRYLKGTPKPDLAKAKIFLSGSNTWHTFTQWPPPEAQAQNLYLHPNGGLSFDKPTAPDGFDEYTSDPAKPVPHTPKIVIHRDDRYVVQDQRFAATRPDVLVYQTPPLDEDLTVAGDLFASLFVATSGTDADYIVKLIDVYPPDAEYVGENPHDVQMGGFQLMVRGKVMRAKFRNSFEHPEPLVPNEVTEITFEMQDVGHTFCKGHRLMVHVQSTWFPLVDRNPQTFVDIYNATEADYQKATHRIYHCADYPSHLTLKRLQVAG